MSSWSSRQGKAPLTVRHGFIPPFQQEEPWFTMPDTGVEIETFEEEEEEEALADLEVELDGEGPEPQEGLVAAEGGQQRPREYKVGIIVVDHGSRRAEANAALEGVVADFRKVSGYDLVEPAHMELAEPSIATAFGRCVEQGATFIVCHPFFLSRGRHVVEDIPTLMEEAASIFPGVGWALSQPLGLQAEIPRLMQMAVSDCMREQNIESEDHVYGIDGMGL